jgi:hypothetical protein
MNRRVTEVAAEPMRRAKIPICLVLPVLPGPLNATDTGRGCVSLLSWLISGFPSQVVQSREGMAGPRWSYPVASSGPGSSSEVCARKSRSAEYSP